MDAWGDGLEGQAIAGCIVEKLLGAGSLGEVYRCARPDGEKVAIKILYPEVAAIAEAVERFEREARLCYQIDHPNLIHVRTWGIHEERPYLIMDYIEGVTLAGLAQKHGTKLNWQVAVAIVAEISDAVQALHDVSVVHRDIKPTNILVNAQGHGVLADLGLARQWIDSIDENDARRLTMPGRAIGSPAYMSPEQVNDTAAVGPVADIYSLGATLYHALVGRPPFLGDTAQAVLKQVVLDEPNSLATCRNDLPPEIITLVAQAMEKQQANRPQKAGKWAESLRQTIN